MIHAHPTTATAKRVPFRARLTNDLRHAERDWQGFVRFNSWPGGNPWAEQRDEAAARYARIKAQLAEINSLSLAPVTVLGVGSIAA